MNSDQAFAFTLSGATEATYDNIISGLSGLEAGLGSIGSWTIQTAGIVSTFSYDNLGGVDLVITTIPEPGSLVALCGGLGTLLGLQRFRRRRG